MWCVSWKVKENQCYNVMNLKFIKSHTDIPRMCEERTTKIIWIIKKKLKIKNNKKTTVTTPR